MALVQFALERSRYTQISSGKTHAGQLKEAAQEGSMTRLEASARLPHLSRMVVAGLWAFLLAIPCADARITRIEIDAANSQNPTFGGRSFQGPGGTVGTYEKITARAYGEVDPTDPHNSMIVDFGFAPTNASGKVEYSINFVILKPVDLTQGSHRLFALLPNRGNPSGFRSIRDCHRAGLHSRNH